MDEVERVLTSGDPDRIGDLYTDDGQLLPPGSEIVTGRDAIAEFWIGLGDMGVETIEIEPLEVEEYGSAASRVGHATLLGADGEVTDRVKFVELWHATDGDWRIHRDIWNSNESDG